MNNDHDTIKKLTEEVQTLRTVLAAMTVDVDKPLRNLIRDRRKELGMLQSDLAEKLDVKRNYVSMIETGATPVPRLRLHDIAHVLDLDPRKVVALAMLDDMRADG